MTRFDEINDSGKYDIHIQWLAQQLSLSPAGFRVDQQDYLAERAIKNNKLGTTADDVPYTRSTIRTAPIVPRTLTEVTGLNIPVITEPSRSSGKFRITHVNLTWTPGIRWITDTQSWMLQTNIFGYAQFWLHMPGENALIGNMYKFYATFKTTINEGKSVRMITDDYDDRNGTVVNGLVRIEGNARFDNTKALVKTVLKYNDGTPMDLKLVKLEYYIPPGMTYNVIKGPAELRAAGDPIDMKTTDTVNGLYFRSMDFRFNDTDLSIYNRMISVVGTRGITKTADDDVLTGAKAHKLGKAIYDKQYNSFLFSDFPSTNPNKLIGTRLANEPCEIVAVRYWTDVV